MLRQPFVDERIVGIQQIQNAAVLVHDAVEEQLDLPPERLSQVVVEVRIEIDQRIVGLQGAHVQPLAREVLDERFRSRIREHAAHLLLEHRGFFQPALRRHRHQLVVRNAAPEEEGQARGQLPGAVPRRPGRRLLRRLPAARELPDRPPGAEDDGRAGRGRGPHLRPHRRHRPRPGRRPDGHPDRRRLQRPAQRAPPRPRVVRRCQPHPRGRLRGRPPRTAETGEARPAGAGVDGGPGEAEVRGSEPRDRG